MFDRTELSLVPLGAGDLIDRAVRFYRKFFWTFVLIAAPPVIVGTLVSVGWTITGRQRQTKGILIAETQEIARQLGSAGSSRVILLTV